MRAMTSQVMVKVNIFGRNIIDILAITKEHAISIIYLVSAHYYI